MRSVSVLIVAALALVACLAVQPVAVSALTHGRHHRHPVTYSDLSAVAVTDSAPPPATTKIFAHQRFFAMVQGILNTVLQNEMKNVHLPDTTIKVLLSYIILTESQRRKQ
jgi:hypothetical protein